MMSSPSDKSEFNASKNQLKTDNSGTKDFRTVKYFKRCFHQTVRLYAFDKNRAVTES